MSLYAYVCTGRSRFREHFGLSFEDLHEGMRIRHRPGIDVSQQDNREDAVDLVNNAQLHFDSHYAAQTEWKKPLGVSTIGPAVARHDLAQLVPASRNSWHRQHRNDPSSLRRRHALCG